MQSFTDSDYTLPKGGKPSLFVPTLSNSNGDGDDPLANSGDMATAAIHGS